MSGVCAHKRVCVCAVCLNSFLSPYFYPFELKFSIGYGARHKRLYIRISIYFGHSIIKSGPCKITIKPLKVFSLFIKYNFNMK